MSERRYTQQTIELFGDPVRVLISQRTDGEYQCELDGQHSREDSPDRLQGYGSGETASAAIRSYCGNCHLRDNGAYSEVS